VTKQMGRVFKKSLVMLQWPVT